jgi:hypothetical protein
MKKNHDIGGQKFGLIPQVELPWQYWEKQVEAIRILIGDDARRLMSSDELRRGFESFTEEKYDGLSFYRRRLEAIIEILIEKKVFTPDELREECDRCSAKLASVTA